MLPVYAFGAAVRGKITPGNRRRDVSIQVKPPAYLQGRGIKIDSPNQKGACGFLPQAQADRVFNPDANGFTIAVRVKTTNNAYMQRVVTKRGTSFVFASTSLSRKSLPLGFRRQAARSAHHSRHFVLVEFTGQQGQACL